MSLITARRLGLFLLILGAAACRDNDGAFGLSDTIQVTVWVEKSEGLGSGRVFTSSLPDEDVDCTLTAGVPSGTTTPGTCSASFRDAGGGGVFGIAAAPAPGSVFAEWSVTKKGESNTKEDCPGAVLICEVRFGAFDHDSRRELDIEVKARFELVPQHTLTVTGAGTGDGSVESGPTGINCTITDGEPTAGTCEAVFAENTTVTLTPTPAAGSVFVVWTGDCGGAGSCAVTMTANKSAVAQFGLQAGNPFTRSLFATVIDAFTIDFNGTGDLFVGNTGKSVNIPGLTYVRKVTPALEITDFGDRVSDPDIVLVDKLGSIASVPQSVLVGGITDFGTAQSRITEITPDGTTTPLIEITGPTLSNPSAFAFLPNGKLLIGNYGSNTVSVLSKDPQGALSLAEFYTDISTDGFVAVAFHKGVVYVITRSGKLTTLDESGGVIKDDLWSASGILSPPTALAADISDVFFDGDLLVATGTRLFLMDTDSEEFSSVGNFTFDNGIFGLAVSPRQGDGGLYVSEGDAGQIWRVVKN